MSKIANLVTYNPSVDLLQFRLVAEATPEALANDVEKFSKISESGIDMHILGTFLAGVSLIKLKKIVGTAKRGVHGGGDAGWMKFTAHRFPHLAHRSLTNAVNFSKAVFEQWQNPKLESGFQLRNGDEKPNKTIALAVPQEPLSFQLPENPEELKGLLTAIHDTMDGKTVTALYRSSGRIRDAQRQGTYERKPRDLRKEIEGAAEVDEDTCNEFMTLAMMLADGRSPIFGEQKTAMLHRVVRAAKAVVERGNALIKARTSKGTPRTTNA